MYDVWTRAGKAGRLGREGKGKKKKKNKPDGWIVAGRGGGNLAFLLFDIRCLSVGFGRTDGLGLGLVLYLYGVFPPGIPKS